MRSTSVRSTSVRSTSVRSIIVPWRLSPFRMKNSGPFASTCARVGAPTASLLTAASRSAIGQESHSIIQRYLTFLFMLKRKEWGIQVFPELRTQTQSRRFRVPDILVTRAEDKFERYVISAPLIAIEILSPEDRLVDMQAKARSTATSASPISGSSIPSAASPTATPEQVSKKQAASSPFLAPPFASSSASYSPSSISDSRPAAPATTHPA